MSFINFLIWNTVKTGILVILTLSSLTLKWIKNKKINIKVKRNSESTYKRDIFQLNNLKKKY